MLEKNGDGGRERKNKEKVRRIMRNCIISGGRKRKRKRKRKKRRWKRKKKRKKKKKGKEKRER